GFGGGNQACRHRKRRDAPMTRDAYGRWQPTPKEPTPTPRTMARIAEARQRNAADFVHAELSRLPGEQTEINAALAAIDGTRPENELAAMLASQMVVTHGLARDMLGRIRRAALLVQAGAIGPRATKLLRPYTMQMEVLAKLKRGGQQTVRVQHMQVYPEPSVPRLA